MAKKVDLSRLTVAELEEIGSEVLRTLATRVDGARSRDEADHQKHIGMHTRNTAMDIDELVFE